MADDRQAALNAIDLKGNIVLKEFGDTALLFRPQNNYEPFVVAYGYDKSAGEWSHGSYHTDLGHAFEEANPEIIEDACLRPTTGRSGCRIWSMSFAKAPGAHRAMRFRGTSRMAGKLSSRIHI